jgi:AraC-like DNA-binding protein
MRVCFPYENPGYSDLYEKIFGCPVYYNRKDCKLSFPKEVLDIPNELANKDVLELCIRQCEIIHEDIKTNDTISNEVEALIMTSNCQIPNASEVAQQLGTSVRTFYRRLHDEGITYNGIVEKMRRHLAEEYLRNTNVPIKEIAYTLGFSEPGNFFRAFKRWFGITPLKYREGKDD